MAAAREPDKIQHTQLVWQDDELLLRVLEERFHKFHDRSVPPSEMWSKYFCPRVNNLPTREYFLDRILKRPRDLIYFVKAAMETAVNRGHGRVEDGDVFEAERQYSQFALSSLVVENVVSIPNIERILYEFAGQNSVMSWNDICDCMRRAQVPSNEIEDIAVQLCISSFLGLELNLNTFRFTEDPNELRKVQVLSNRFCEITGHPHRFAINNAFRAFLEILE